MALLGQGDPRWLVEKREDGTNVNAWHWSEKDALPWSRVRLAELLGNLTLLDGAGGGPAARTTGIKSVEGDAVLNVRKAKLIASYELAIKVDWKGTASGGVSTSGFLELPYVADENHDEEPELKVVLPVEDAAAQELKTAILARGKQPILDAIATFVQELRDGVPAKAGAAAAAAGGGADADATSAAKPATPAAAAAAAVTAAAPTTGGAGATAAPAASSSGAGGSRSVSITQQFYASRTDLYECFTVQGRLVAFTRSPAVVDARPGGALSLFGGGVVGSYEQLVPGERLVLTWRFNSWEDGCTSRVELSFAEPEPGNTIVTLHHTGLPEADRYGHAVPEQVERGWEEQIFGRIRAVFGYGV